MHVLHTVTHIIIHRAQWAAMPYIKGCDETLTAVYPQPVEKF